MFDFDRGTRPLPHADQQNDSDYGEIETTGLSNKDIEDLSHEEVEALNASMNFRLLDAFSRNNLTQRRREVQKQNEDLIKDILSRLPKAHYESDKKTAKKIEKSVKQLTSLFKNNHKALQLIDGLMGFLNEKNEYRPSFDVILEVVTRLLDARDIYRDGLNLFAQFIDMAFVSDSLEMIPESLTTLTELGRGRVQNLRELDQVVTSYRDIYAENDGQQSNADNDIKLINSCHEIFQNSMDRFKVCLALYRQPGKDGLQLLLEFKEYIGGDNIKFKELLDLIPQNPTDLSLILRFSHLFKDNPANLKKCLDIMLSLPPEKRTTLLSLYNINKLTEKINTISDLEEFFDFARLDDSGDINMIGLLIGIISNTDLISFSNILKKLVTIYQSPDKDKNIPLIHKHFRHNYYKEIMICKLLDFAIDNSAEMFELLVLAIPSFKDKPEKMSEVIKIISEVFSTDQKDQANVSSLLTNYWQLWQIKPERLPLLLKIYTAFGENGVKILASCSRFYNEDEKKFENTVSVLMDFLGNDLDEKYKQKILANLDVCMKQTNGATKIEFEELIKLIQEDTIQNDFPEDAEAIDKPRYENVFFQGRRTNLFYTMEVFSSAVNVFNKYGQDALKIFDMLAISVYPDKNSPKVDKQLLSDILEEIDDLCNSDNGKEKAKLLLGNIQDSVSLHDFKKFRQVLEKKGPVVLAVMGMFRHVLADAGKRSDIVKEILSWKNDEASTERLKVLLEMIKNRSRSFEQFKILLEIIEEYGIEKFKVLLYMETLITENGLIIKEKVHHIIARIAQIEALPKGKEIMQDFGHLVVLGKHDHLELFRATDSDFEKYLYNYHWLTETLTELDSSFGARKLQFVYSPRFTHWRSLHDNKQINDEDLYHILRADDDFDFSLLSNAADVSDLDALIKAMKTGKSLLAHPASKKDAKQISTMISNTPKTEQDKDNEVVTINIIEYSRYKFPSPDVELTMTDENWIPLLLTYLAQTNPAHYIGNYGYSNEDKARVKNRFLSNEPKNFCLKKLNELWQDYLANPNPGIVPLGLKYVSQLIEYLETAGAMSRFEAMAKFSNAFLNAQVRPTTASKTKLALFDNMKILEKQFLEDKWQRTEISDFHNIMRSMIDAAPSLAGDFMQLFIGLDREQSRDLLNKILPLYRAKLALVEKEGKEDNDEKTHDLRKLVEIRKNLRLFQKTDKTPVNIEKEKQRLLADLKTLFMIRFGITKTPDSFTEEHFRAMLNIPIYLSNFHNKKSDSEAILAFYLALILNNKWHNLRSYQEINPDEFLTPEMSKRVKKILTKRRRLRPVSAQAVGINESELAEFMDILQNETQNVTIANIETVDVKLSNAIQNLEELKDPDAYPDPMEKDKLQLYKTFGNEILGEVVGNMFLELSGKQKPNNEDAQESLREKVKKSLSKHGQEGTDSEIDREIARRKEREEKARKMIKEILTRHGLDLTATNINIHFQRNTKVLSSVFGLFEEIESTNAEEMITELQSLLIPTPEIIEIFNKLGEDFRPTSGVMALSQDIDYLHGLIVKRGDELTPEQQTQIKDYLAKISDKLKSLTEIYEKVKIKFNNFAAKINLNSTDPKKKCPLDGKYDNLKNKFKEIGKILNSNNPLTSFTSTATNNLNMIIEHMRECLACKREGCNNDTNLSFGDPTQFYIVSQTDIKSSQSVSDQIAFFEPVRYPTGRQSMAFVLDRLYGNKSESILLNHIDVLAKKVRKLKKRFPNGNIDIVITDSAMKSAGISANVLYAKLKTIYDNVENPRFIDVDVKESPWSDHYIEFGGEYRRSGRRRSEGIVIRF